MSSRRLPLSQFMDSTLRLAEYLPGPLREALHWWLFRKPFPHRRTAEQLEILQSARPFLVPSGPYLLRGYRYPSPGPTVVLTHGWQGSAASWFRLVPLLVQAGYSVVTFDAPGHSGGPRVVTLPLYAQGLADVVRLFEPVHALVGHSFGGMASARVARDLPDLKALVLLGTPDEKRAIMAGFTHRMGMRELSKQAFEKRVQAAFPGPLEEEATSLYVSRVSCPVLVLHDENDDMIPMQAAHQIASVPHATLMLTQGLGHRGIIRDPATMARVVEFLES